MTPTMPIPENSPIWRRALQKTLDVSWLIMKIYIPLSILTTLLKQWGVLDFIAPYFYPLMQYFGLPGEASVAFIAAFSNTVFAALATMSALDLTARQVTILAVIFGISHNLIVETGVLIQTGLATWRIALFRIALGCFMGLLMHQALPESVPATFTPVVREAGAFSWPVYLQGLGISALQILLVIAVIMTLYELMRDWPWAARLSRTFAFIPKWLGYSQNAIVAWLVGFFIGITYGAGILLQLSRENIMSHKDAALITVFLCVAHAIVEDTIFFAFAGGNFWWIIITRTLLAVTIVKIMSINNWYLKFLWIGLPKKTMERSAELL